MGALLCAVPSTARAAVPGWCPSPRGEAVAGRRAAAGRAGEAAPSRGRDSQGRRAQSSALSRCSPGVEMSRWETRSTMGPASLEALADTRPKIPTAITPKAVSKSS